MEFLPASLVRVSRSILLLWIWGQDTFKSCICRRLPSSLNHAGKGIIFPSSTLSWYACHLLWSSAPSFLCDSNEFPETQFMNKIFSLNRKNNKIPFSKFYPQSHSWWYMADTWDRFQSSPPFETGFILSLLNWFQRIHRKVRNLWSPARSGCLIAND